MIDIREYHNRGGQSLFREWYDRLNAEATEDQNGSIPRRTGKLLQCQSVGVGVYECKVNFGPGYRVYFGKEGEEIIILLGGSTKQRQQNDIKLAGKTTSKEKSNRRKKKERRSEYGFDSRF